MIKDVINKAKREKKKAQNIDTAKKIGVGVGIGAAIGSTLGVLLAPKSGKETREDISNAAINVKKGVEKVTETVDTVGETVSDTFLSITTGTREAAEYIKIITDIVNAVITTFTRHK